MVELQYEFCRFCLTNWNSIGWVQDNCDIDNIKNAVIFGMTVV